MVGGSDELRCCPVRRAAEPVQAIKIIVDSVSESPHPARTARVAPGKKGRDDTGIAFYFGSGLLAEIGAARGK